MTDTYRFATISEDAKKFSPEKTGRIRELVRTYKWIYEQLLTYENEQIQQSAESLLKLINSL